MGEEVLDLTLPRQTTVCGRRDRVAHASLLMLIVLVVGVSDTGAQQVEGRDPHRWAAAIAIDAGSIPDAFAFQCGSGTTPSVGGGLAALVRPRRWLLAAADTRVSTVPDRLCGRSLPVPQQIGPNEYETQGYKQYQNGVPPRPLVQSALHVGVETPTRFVRLRATVGGGVIWTGHGTPFGTAAVGIASSDRGIRVYGELETSVCRVQAREEHTRFRRDSNTTTPLPSRIVSYAEHPRWTLLHLGIEVPLASWR